MAFHRMTAMTLLVLLALVWGQVTSAALDSASGKSEAFNSTDRSADSGCPRRIPPGYRYHEGLGYYRMHYAFRNWYDAELVCAAEGGYLVVVNSQNEANLITRLMREQGLSPLVHIGVSNVNKKGQYLTVLGENLWASGYAVWAPGQPTNVNNEYCVALEIDKGMHDVWCTDEYPYVCELD